jgi:hypothetical protein
MRTVQYNLDAPYSVHRLQDGAGNNHVYKFPEEHAAELQTLQDNGFGRREVFAFPTAAERDERYNELTA